MEIRNNTPISSAPAFGMALKKPSPKVMEELEGYLSPRSLKAFVKEQSKNKIFDIEATLDKKDILGFKVVPKHDVETLGYASEKAYNINPEKATFVDVYCDQAEVAMRNFKKKHPRMSKSKLIRSFICIENVLKVCTKSLYALAFKPARTVTPALRAAGDEANLLDRAVVRSLKNAEKCSKIIENA